MNLDQFTDWAQLQPPLLYPPNRAEDAGQCYQLVNFYMDMVWHRPLIWQPFAYLLMKGAEATGTYEVIYNNPNDPNQLPPRGAVVVFDRSLPGSAGMGHTDIFLQAYGTGAWIGLDANWGGKVAHKVTHNWSYVVGWFYPKSQPAPAPAATPAPQGGDEMISTIQDAINIYKMLRPNGNPSQDEIDGTAGRRTYKQFVSDAQPEISQRDQSFNAMQATINSQNATITDLTTKLTDAEATGQEKQAALTESLQKIASDNADLATLHDKVAEFNANPVVKAQNAATAMSKQPSNAGKLLASFISAFSKFSLSKKKK